MNISMLGYMLRWSTYSAVGVDIETTVASCRVGDEVKSLAEFSQLSMGSARVLNS